MSTTDRPIRGTDPSTAAPPAPPAGAREPSFESEIGALIAELGEESLLLLRQEVALAKAELRESSARVAGAGAGLGVAALVGSLAVAVLAVAAGLGLAEVMPAGLAFLVVGLVLAAVALGAWSIGRRNLRAVDPVPRRTIDTVKEDLRWLRTRMS